MRIATSMSSNQEFQAGWNDVPGLLSHVLKNLIRYHAPLPLFSILVCWILTDSFGLWLCAFFFCSSFLFQFGFQCLVSSLFVIPIQNNSFRLIDWIVSSPSVAKYAGGLSAGLQPMAMQLYAMRQRVEQSRAALSSLRNAQPLRVSTPDGCVLDGMLLRADSTAPKGCIIYLGGNGEFFELNQAMRVWTQQGFSVLLFNYRGVGNSTGLLLRHGPVIDACTMIAYATKILMVPQNRIVLFGHSIGGGFATEAAQLCPQVFVVNDRSFGTLSRVGLYHILLNAVVGPAAKTSAALLLRYMFVQILRHAVCFELDSVSRWQSISRARKLCVYTDEDKVIPSASQLAHMVLELNIPHDRVGCFLRMDRRSSVDAHNIELSSSEYRRVFTAIESTFSGTPLPDAI